MSKNKEIRWRQRFKNLENAFLFLQNGLESKLLNPLEEAGIIQAFEFTFELAWKTLKDYLESQGSLVTLPRETIKEAFSITLIKDGELWLEMLEKRNMLSHTYDREQ